MFYWTGSAILNQQYRKTMKNFGLLKFHDNFCLSCLTNTLVPTKICILLKVGKINVLSKIQKHVHFTNEGDRSLWIKSRETLILYWGHKLPIFLNGPRGQMTWCLDGVFMTNATFFRFFKSMHSLPRNCIINLKMN